MLRAISKHTLQSCYSHCPLLSPADADEDLSACQQLELLSPGENCEATTDIQAKLTIDHSLLTFAGVTMRPQLREHGQ